MSGSRGDRVALVFLALGVLGALLLGGLLIAVLLPSAELCALSIVFLSGPAEAVRRTVSALDIGCPTTLNFHVAAYG